MEKEKVLEVFRAPFPGTIPPRNSYLFLIIQSLNERGSMKPKSGRPMRSIDRMATDKISEGTECRVKSGEGFERRKRAKTKNPASGEEAGRRQILD
jgi:hypothetical protein